MRLILVRHGESEGNVRGIIQGRADYPLAPRGRQQALAVAAALRAEGLAPAALYASPLARAAATAAEIGRALGVAPTLDPDLQECDVGDATGLTWPEFAARFPEWAARVEGNADGRSVDEVWPRGETTSTLRARCRRAVERIVERHADESADRERAVIVVSHGGAISWMLARLLDPEADTWPAWSLPNGSISEVIVARGAVTARRIGQIAARRSVP